MRALAASAFVLLWLAVASAEQAFRINVDAVQVDVLVTDGNRPVGGLHAADFELHDSGVLQRVDSVTFQDVPLSIMLALDASSSMRGASLDNLKAAAGAVVSLLRPGDRAALLTFSEETDLACGWTADGKQLEQAVAATRASGSTALHDATYAALTMSDPQPGGRSLVLIFSDGDDTVSWLSGQTVLEVARRTNAVVYGVGLPSDARRSGGYLVDFLSGVQPDVPRVVPAAVAKHFLHAIAEETGGKYIVARHSDRLGDSFVHVLMSEFRTRYVLTYTPAGVGTAGWHPIAVKVKGRKATVTARRGYSR